MNIHTYRIHYLLRSQIEKIKHGQGGSESDNICWTSFLNNQLQSSNGKKHQLVDQMVCKAIIHFTTCTWAKNEHKNAGDILPNLSGENGRRKPYATLIQDSRRR